MIWTRGQDDWAADAELLVQRVPAAVAVRHVPCIALSAVVPAGRSEAVEAARFMVFTSAHAVNFALAQPAVARAAARVEKIYTHGQATAALLRKHGLNVELVSSVRTAQGLGAWLAAALPSGAAVLVPGPKVPAYDLAGALRGAGLAAAAWVCYETEARARVAAGRGGVGAGGVSGGGAAGVSQGGVPADQPAGSDTTVAVPAFTFGAELTAAAVQAAVAEWNGVICFASPSAVAGFAAVFQPATNRLRAALVAYAIGPTTAQAALGLFAQVHSAPRNELESLIEVAVAGAVRG